MKIVHPAESVGDGTLTTQGKIIGLRINGDLFLTTFLFLIGFNTSGVRRFFRSMFSMFSVSMLYVRSSK